MAKHLNTILKKYSDVISGKLPASKVGSLSLGDQPGVDYAPKSQGDRDFVASHSVEMHPDRNGNGDEVFKASNMKMTDTGRHGHIPSPKDERVYKQANEEYINEAGMPKGVIKHKQDLADLSDKEFAEKHGNKSEKELRDMAARHGYGWNKATKTGSDHYLRRVERGKKVDEEFEIEEKYMGFEKTKKALADKGAKDPAALAAWIGRKKYGKEKFQKAAAEGKKLKEAKDDKDEREYGYEGEMAISQIKSIMNHAGMLMKMLKPDTDMPEWVQSKITLANDYIQTAADYFATEMTEETENDDGWYAHREMHGSKGVSKEDWKKGYRLNSKGEKVMTKKSPKKDIKEAKCNMSEAGTMCEVHGMKACPSEETQSASDKEPRYNGKDKVGKRKLLTDKNLQEKAESVAQQKLMAMALAYKRGEMKDASSEVKKLASSMTEKQLRDFAKTKHEGLPQHVQKEQAPAVTPITFPVTNSREGFKL